MLSKDLITLYSRVPASLSTWDRQKNFSHNGRIDEMSFLQFTNKILLGKLTQYHSENNPNASRFTEHKVWANYTNQKKV